MNLNNIVRTIQTYKNPLWFYAVCMKLVQGPLAKLSLRNGLHFYVRVQNTDWYVIHEVYAKNTYDEALKGLDPTNSVVIDIGGFIGDFSIKASRLARHVYTYEPEKDNYRLLNMNVQENNIKNITARPYGISDKPGSFSIYVSDTNSSCNTMYSELSKNAVSTQSIECVTLADECKKYRITNIDLLKLDCEGAEFDILMSIPDSLLTKINKIIFEYQDMVEKNKTHQKLIQHLETHGFHSKIIDQMDNKTGTILAWRD
jgi:FkbM family methyltransferase